jgi:hypothetical protein
LVDFELDELLEASNKKAPVVLQEVYSFVLSSFEKFDINADGFLSRQEIEQALLAPERTMKQTAFLHFLLERIAEIAAASKDDAEEDSISRSDLKAYFEQL